ncbi:MAG: hypothetical protein JWQ58_999 [Reyranella sp.]|nr:hypothetical protein [Reyranella sp.]
MLKLALCTAAALVFLGSAGFAADPSVASSTLPSEKAPAMTTTRAVPATGDFLAKVTAGNRFEIDSSELALKKSQSAEVQAFAKRMVADHGEVAAKFQQALGEAKLSSGPDALDARHRVILDDLATKDGADFDKTYLAAEAKAHEQSVALFQSYADGGDNARLKQFAGELLPVLKKHLEQVSKISG